MKFLRHLNEEYEGIVAPFWAAAGKYATVYKNPTSTEIIKAGKEQGESIIRFIGDLEKNDFYVWNASCATHDDVGHKFGIYSYINRGNCIYGKGVVGDEGAIRTILYLDGNHERVKQKDRTKIEKYFYPGARLEEHFNEMVNI